MKAFFNKNFFLFIYKSRGKTWERKMSFWGATTPL